jgi:glycosyltransferase involved in cell wall biosynthesis
MSDGQPRKPPTIAAAIAVYNGAKLIRRSLDSILAQTRPADEVIVVDDGSTDRTAEVVQGYGPRVRYIRQENSGVSTARNQAAREAQSEWIAFLDHDDEWLPEKLARQAAAVEADAGADLCYTAYWMAELDGSRHPAHIPADRIWPSARMRNPFPPSVVMIRREPFLKLGGFYEGLKKAGVEDWEFFARFLAGHRAVEVTEPLANYYVVPNSASRNHQRMLADSLEIVDRGLLEGLTGATRKLWRRRIRGIVYYRIAISAREEGSPSAGLLVQSFREWPFPDVAPNRWKTAAAWLVRGIRGSPGPEPHNSGNG